MGKTKFLWEKPSFYGKCGPYYTVIEIEFLRKKFWIMGNAFPGIWRLGGPLRFKIGQTGGASDFMGADLLILSFS